MLIYPGRGNPILVEQIGFYAQDLLTFSGRDLNKIETFAIVHVNTVELIMKYVAKNSEIRAPRKIGFVGEKNPRTVDS